MLTPETVVKYRSGGVLMETWGKDARREAVITDLDALVPKDHLLRKVEKVQIMKRQQKDSVILDIDALNKMGVYTISDILYTIEDGVYRHDALKTAYLIFSYLMDGKK